MLTKVKTLLQKVIKQNRKMILKLGIILLLGFSFLPQQKVFVFNEVMANDKQPVGKEDEQVQRESLISMTTFFQVLSNLAYVILWPLVALAGLAMDNSLIYGSFMKLDVPLWKIWQITRTFANYTLGVLFLIGIIVYNFSPSGKIGLKGIKTPGDLIKKTLIASVLIQASWFLLMALVDLSTILTYSIGGIPTAITKNLVEDAEENKINTRMLEQNVLLNLGDTKAESTANANDVIMTYYGAISGSNATYVAPCKVLTRKVGSGNQSFIIGRTVIQLTGTDSQGKAKPIAMSPGYCVYYGSLVSYNEFYDDAGSKTGYRDSLEIFQNDIRNAEKEKLKQLVDAGIIYPISAGEIPYLSGALKKSEVKFADNRTYEGKVLGCEENNILGVVPSVASGGEYKCLYNKTNLSLANIFEKTNSMTGPFAALYTSLFTFSSLTSIDGIGVWQKFMIVLINVLFAVLLVLPLGALVIVLFTRIGVLWMVIALSPFIILLNVFDGVFGDFKLGKTFQLGELLKLLLAPVLISFAVSLSLVFMSALKGNLSEREKQQPVIAKEDQVKQDQIRSDFNNLSKVTGMTIENNNELGILGFIKVQLDSVLLNLSWFVTMLFGLGITWFLLFWAIKQTSIGEKIGSSLQALGEKTLGSMPIIPIGSSGLSYNALKALPGDISQKITEPLDRKNREALDALLNTGTGSTSGTGDNESSGGSGTTSYSKNVDTFYGAGGGNFDKAFDLDNTKPEYNTTYANTDDMISRIDGLYSSEKKGDSNIDTEMGRVYKRMIENATTPESLDSIVKDMNKRKTSDGKKSSIQLGDTPIEKKLTINGTEKTFKIQWKEDPGERELIEE